MVSTRRGRSLQDVVGDQLGLVLEWVIAWMYAGWLCAFRRTTKNGPR